MLIESLLSLTKGEHGELELASSTEVRKDHPTRYWSQDAVWNGCNSSRPAASQRFILFWLNASPNHFSTDSPDLGHALLFQHRDYHHFD
jgi:hypothetical protein